MPVLALFAFVGEVIATPILSHLLGTPNEWMQKLVLALHKGDIDNFNLIVDVYKTQYFAQPALAAKHEDVKKKIVLLCLLNIAFEKPSFDRNISFIEIATKTRIPVDQVTTSPPFVSTTVIKTLFSPDSPLIMKRAT